MWTVLKCFYRKRVLLSEHENDSGLQCTWNVCTDTLLVNIYVLLYIVYVHMLFLLFSTQFPCEFIFSFTALCFRRKRLFSPPSIHIFVIAEVETRLWRLRSYITTYKTIYSLGGGGYSKSNVALVTEAKQSSECWTWIRKLCVVHEKPST